MEPILLVGPDLDRLSLIRQVLEAEGYCVDSTDSDAHARQLAEDRQFRVAVCEACHPELDSLLGWLARDEPTIPVILVGLSASCLPPAVRRLSDPSSGLPRVATVCAAEELASSVRCALERSRLRRETAVLHRALKPDYCGDLREGRDEVMSRTLDRARQAATTGQAILLTGEPGSGRDTLARYIHFQSQRCPGVFVHADCLAMSAESQQAALFGASHGSAAEGLLADADGGALFLNELAVLTPGTQEKLFRFLQEGFFTRIGGTRRIWSKVRLIAATSENVPSLLAAGHLREDLLGAYPILIDVPSLRQRPRAIERLANHFLSRARCRLGRPPVPICPDAMAALHEYSWPGNVAELEMTMFRAAVACDDMVGREDLALRPCGQRKSSDGKPWRSIERRAIEEALAQHRGNRTHAARALGISLRKLQYRLREYGLTRISS